VLPEPLDVGRAPDASSRDGSSPFRALLRSLGK
jgi:hypothetical protein